VSLRTRLILGLLVLAALGLIVADFATYASLRSFLVSRIDSGLQSDHVAAEFAPDRCHPSVAPEVFIQIRMTDGSVFCTRQSREPQSGPGPGGSDEGRAEETRPAPNLPANLDLVEGPGEHPRYFDASAVSGGSSYRVRAAYEPEIRAVMIVATPLDELRRTLNRLLIIEVLVTAAVLGGIALLGLWVVRLSLRPLDAIGHTAAAIAAGDLSRRVEPANERSEIGRLGLALNAMLHQIEAAFKAREASERKLRRFVADASHELRTPLAAVRAYAELFTRGARRRPDDLERTMTGIGRESERMSVLVEDLLLLARLDEGRPLAREPVELQEVVAEAVETAATVEPQRQIELHAEPAAVLGDRDRLRQIVDNLLSNVRAHTPADAPVRVSLERRNGSAVVEVADSGPGMSAEEAAHVFERFYRADASRSRASGGVGLGLSIVAAVAEAHGGSVSARSVPGRGSTFQIMLPLARESEPNGNRSVSP
jgi:two-component system, OmpR family, sensor kinase